MRTAPAATTVLVCAIAPIAAGLACSGRHDAPPPPAAQSTATNRATPPAATPRAATASRAATVTAPGLCSSVAIIVDSIVAAYPPADTAHRSRLSGPDTVTFKYQWVSASAPGCRMSVKGTDSLARNGTLGSVDDGLKRSGWHPADSLYEADGPDGSMRGFLKGDTLCVLEQEWDGEDDADSTYVPRPDFSVTLTCAPRRPDDHPPS